MKFFTREWTGYKKADPLLVSTEHRGNADGKPVHIWISDVAVKVTGSDKWMTAQYAYLYRAITKQIARR